MYRLFISFVLIAFVISQISCVKYINPPPAKAQALMSGKPWYLSYTDSTFYDSLNIAHTFRIISSECEREQAVNFISGGNLSVKLVCNQAMANAFSGYWDYFQDSSIDYGSPADTGVYQMAGQGHIMFVTTDSLQLMQESNLFTPDIRFENLDQIKTYSH
jgi:hypothetical protein